VPDRDSKVTEIEEVVSRADHEAEERSEPQGFHLGGAASIGVQKQVNCSE